VTELQKPSAGQGRPRDPPQHRTRRFPQHQRHPCRPGRLRPRDYHRRRAARSRAAPVQRPVTESGVPHPWDTGDLERNWQGYLIPGTSILRNRVGAQTPDALRDAENDLVEARVIELREAPDFLGDRTYDLAYLSDPPSALSGRVRLAGDVRTVASRRAGNLSVHQQH